MTKFNIKNSGIIIFCVIFLIGVLGIISVVSAQQTLPKGGDGFETAVEIQPGSYEGAGLIEKGVKEYFYINVKPGQELKLEGAFNAFSDAWGEETLGLYNEDRKNLSEAGTSLDKGEKAQFSFLWLSNADKDSYKYYIKRECTWHQIELLSLDISLTDRYDAGSQTDAGDTVEKAMNIISGEYTGYLSGKAGADTKDYYKVAVRKGKTLIVKVTPPSEAIMRVAFYDKDRRVLKDEYASNPGAIVTNSVTMAKSGDVFAAVVCDRNCSKNLVTYTLDITTEGEPIEGAEVEEGIPYDIGEGTPYGVEGTDIAKAVGKGIATIIILWVVVPIVLLIIIGAVIYFIWKKKKKEKKVF